MRSGSLAVPASPISASRSASAASTKSIKLSAPPGRFLLDAADARALRRDDRAALRRKVAADEAEERGLAGPVAPHEPNTGSRRQRRAGVVDQEALAKPIAEAVDVEHGELFARYAPGRKGEGSLVVAALTLAWTPPGDQANQATRRKGRPALSGLVRNIQNCAGAIEVACGAGADERGEDE